MNLYFNINMENIYINIIIHNNHTYYVLLLLYKE